jgi:hypothetical protein
MDEDRFERLREDVAIGKHHASASDYRELDFAQRLALRQAERDDLWRMTYEQRLARYRAGELTGYQLSVWCDSWHELPKVNDVPEWMASTLVDIVDEGKG